MKIIDQNGREIEGTFMLEAKGLDYNNPDTEADAIDKDSMIDPEGRGLKSLADLQVIDYLSGNIDRHQGNMFYQFDEKQKLIGVVGIDNDCAFRMDHNYVRIIPDNEFYRMTQKHIQAEEKQGNAENIFSLANYAVSNISRRRLSAEENYKKLEAKVTLQADNRCFPEEQKKAREQAAAMVTTLEKNTKWLRSSSNYRDMETAAENYEKFQKKLEERIRLANRPNVKNKKDYRLDLEAIVTPEDLQKMQELSEKLEKAAEKYLKGKLGKGEKLEDYSPYTQGRIRTAQTVIENAKKNKVIKSYEKNAAEVNAREARENLARRLGNQKEAQDIKKGRLKAPLQDAPKKGL